MLIVLACTPQLITSCTHGDGLIPDTARLMAERKAGPPESVWNSVGIWQKIADSPPTYIPKGYPRSLPRTAAEGVWFQDQRDGKRIFVPNRPVGRYDAEILRHEAAKVTSSHGTFSEVLRNNWSWAVPMGFRLPLPSFPTSV
ncbi:MAG: hypothetical protein MUF04_00905 [Akkermansiaceae bacterium]|nr:hypothetical protein [Akkermansiaceae bacterium]